MTTIGTMPLAAVSRQPLGEGAGHQAPGAGRQVVGGRPSEQLSLGTRNSELGTHAAPGTQHFSVALAAARAGKSQAARAEEAAASFVAVAFIEPVLASMSKSTFAEAPFAPGDAERRFQPMLHSLLADRIAHAARFPLTDAVAERLMGRGSHLPSAIGRQHDVMDLSNRYEPTPGLIGEVIHA